MSGNKKRPRAAVSEEKAQPLKVDEDLLCLICTDLVADARHVTCCGGLFCALCIDTWLNQSADGRQACPNCRTVVDKASVLLDVRSDRKSAAQPRRCPFHTDHDCDFVGTRQEVVAHEAACPCDPDLCTSNRCKAEKAAVVAERAAERAAWESERTKERAAWDTEKTRLALEIRKLKDTVTEKEKLTGTAAAAVQKALVSAAFATPEQILKQAYCCDGVKIVAINTAKKYSIVTTKAGEENSLQDVEIEIVEANYNVSMFCNRFTNVAKPTEGYPKMKIVITLVSFDGTTADFKREFTMKSEDDNRGYANWMTSVEFAKYVKDGKFALGWAIIVAP